MSEMPAHHTSAEPLFQPSPTPRASLSTVMLFLLSAVLLLGGIYLTSISFDIGEIGVWVFLTGIIADVIAFWFVFTLIPSKS